MKKIKYFNKIYLEIKREDDIYNIDCLDETEEEFKERPFNITELEYLCTNSEFEYWLDVITKTYGEYGVVKTYDVEDPKTELELQKEMNSNLVKEIGLLNIKINEQMKFNSDILAQLAKKDGGI